MVSSRIEAKFCIKCGSTLRPQQDEEGKQRLTCSNDRLGPRANGDSKPCRHVHYGNPVPVVAAVVEYMKDDGKTSTNEIILVRNIGWPQNMFGLVTGFLEADEEVDTAALREVKEELGLDGRIVSLLGVYDFQRLNQVIIAYHVQAWGNITPCPRELAGFKRVPIQRLQPWPIATGLAVRDFLLARSAKLAADGQQDEAHKLAANAKDMVQLPQPRKVNRQPVTSKL